VALVGIEDREGIAVVALDRAPANAMVPELLEELEAAAARMAAQAPRAVVLTGREGFFSAGADLRAVPGLDAAGQERMVRGINGMAASWYALERPVVAAVNGHAIAGGLVLALCADWRVGAAGAKYGLTEARAGIPYPTCALSVVQAELSKPSARRLALRAHLMDAEEALREGALDEVAPAEDVLARALVRAAELAEVVAYGPVKRQLRAERVAFHARVLAGELPGAPADWIDADSAAGAARAILGGG
jgi:enoyl-CoA hydratase